MVLLHDYLGVCPQRLEEIRRKQWSGYKTGPILINIVNYLHLESLFALEIKACGIHSGCWCCHTAVPSMGSRSTAGQYAESTLQRSLAYPVSSQQVAYFLFYCIFVFKSALHFEYLL